MRWALAAGFLLVAPWESAQAECFGRWQSKWGMEMPGYIVTDGGGCRWRDLRMGATSEVHSISLLTRPQHGTASASISAITYRPRAGFKGEDQFVFALVGKKDGSPQRATIRMHVTVR